MQVCSWEARGMLRQQSAAPGSVGSEPPAGITNPQQQKSKGEPAQHQAEGLSRGLVQLGDGRHHPRQRAMSSLQKQSGKFTLTCLCRRGHRAESGLGEGLVVSPSGGPLFSERTSDRELDGLHSVAWERGLVLPTLGAQAVPLPTPVYC